MAARVPPPETTTGRCRFSAHGSASKARPRNGRSKLMVSRMFSRASRMTLSGRCIPAGHLHLSPRRPRHMPRLAGNIPRPHPAIRGSAPKSTLRQPWVVDDAYPGGWTRTTFGIGLVSGPAGSSRRDHVMAAGSLFERARNAPNFGRARLPNRFNRFLPSKVHGLQQGKERETQSRTDGIGHDIEQGREPLGQEDLLP